MNSPVRGEMKVKTDLDAFNELTTEHKASQEVNNNSTTALNNNTTAAAAISNNNSTIASNKNEPPVNATTVRGEQQAPIAPNTSLNSPSASSTNQISSNNNSSTNSQSSSTNSNSSNHQYSFEYWSQLMKDSKQLQTFSNLFMHVERLLDEGNLPFIYSSLSSRPIPITHRECPIGRPILGHANLAAICDKFLTFQLFKPQQTPISIKTNLLFLSPSSLQRLAVSARRCFRITSSRMRRSSCPNQKDQLFRSKRKFMCQFTNIQMWVPACCWWRLGVEISRLTLIVSDSRESRVSTLDDVCESWWTMVYRTNRRRMAGSSI